MHSCLDGSRHHAGLGSKVRESYLSKVKVEVKAQVNARNIFAQP